jgi:hypothetical protein
MSGDKLDIDPDELAALSGQAANMAASANFVGLVTPPPAVSSLLDTVAVGLSAAIQAMVAPLDTADSAAATEQATMLAESPPVLVQQDQQGADQIGATVIQPTPITAPGPGEVWTT